VGPGLGQERPTRPPPLAGQGAGEPAGSPSYAAFGGGPSSSHGEGVREATPSKPYSQEVPATWAGAGHDMGNEMGDYVQPLGEGGLPPNFDSEFNRNFLPPQLGSEDGDFNNFEDFGYDGGISDGDHDEEGIGDRNGVRFIY
jgi:hypothetical protein